MKKKLGFIVNPVAGLGGRVGLKGSDGADIQRKARELGACPESPQRARQALERLTALKDDLEILTYPLEMGEQVARDMNFELSVIGSLPAGETKAEDTIRAAREMVKREADLIVFAGGDGTARNLYDAIGDSKVPVIGIPSGVKIHSAVYATNPRNAGELALRYLQGNIKQIQDSEVMDIDEEAFREGRVTAKLYGYLKVPHEQRLVQNLKSGRAEGEAAALNSIADQVIEDMDNDVVYIIGPGTTTRAIMEKLGLPNTLLGVDVVFNKKVIASDVTELQLLDLIRGQRARIIVTVIGGQGYIFGRGNQQISPPVLRQAGRENIVIISPQSKLTALGNNPLLIDTGDEEINHLLSGYYRVLTGYQRSVMRKAE